MSKISILHLDTKHLHHVSIVNDWFDLKKLTKYNIKKTDFISKFAIKFVDELDDLQVLVVDDYQIVPDIIKNTKKSYQIYHQLCDTNQLLFFF